MPVQTGDGAPTIIAVPFVRQFGPGATGQDVQAVKRALAAAGYGKDLDTKTPAFGAGAQHALTAFKAKHGLLHTPVYTPQAHGELAPWFDEQDAQLFHAEAVTLADEHDRAAFLDVLDWTVQHQPLFDYTMREPYRSSMLRLRPRQTAQRVGADCSMHFIGCGNWAGLAHRVFHADGFTGTLLDELDRIEPGDARPGDPVVFVGPSWPRGVHVTNLVQKIPGGDWKVCNHGTQGQPVYGTLSGEKAGHAAIAPTLVYLRLPTGHPAA